MLASHIISLYDRIPCRLPFHTFRVVLCGMDVSAFLILSYVISELFDIQMLYNKNLG